MPVECNIMEMAVLVMREQAESKNAPVPPCTHFIRSHSLYGPSFLKIIIHKLIHLRQTVGQLIRELHKVIGCVIVIHPYHISILIQIIQVEGGNLAASKIRNLECPSYEIYLIDYGCGKFNRKIHIMEQYP